MKYARNLEKVLHGLFLVLGTISVLSVILITVFLIVSGLPAIHSIGVIPFLSEPSGPRPQLRPSTGLRRLFSPAFTALPEPSFWAFRWDSSPRYFLQRSLPYDCDEA